MIEKMEANGGEKALASVFNRIDVYYNEGVSYRKAVEAYEGCEQFKVLKYLSIFLGSLLAIALLVACLCKCRVDC